MFVLQLYIMFNSFAPIMQPFIDHVPMTSEAKAKRAKAKAKAKKSMKEKGGE